MTISNPRKGGDGCISSRLKGNGVGCAISVSQSRRDILETIQKEFGGTIALHMDATESARAQYILTWSAKERAALIERLYRHMVLKYDQMTMLIELLTLFHRSGEEDQRRRAQLVKEMGVAKHRWKTGVLPVLPYGRMCDAYVAGVFDAEGCVMVNLIAEKTDEVAFGVSLAQKSNVEFLRKVAEIYGGKVREDGAAWRCASQIAYHFLSKIRFYCRQAKRPQIEAFMECYELFIDPTTKKSQWPRILELAAIVKDEKNVN